MTLGTHEQGGMRKLWIAISQSPERRRRAKLAGKVKRTILELGGNARELESRVCNRHRVVQPPEKSRAPQQSDQRGRKRRGVGWADIPRLAKAMHKTQKEVESAWGARKAELQ